MADDVTQDIKILATMCKAPLKNSYNVVTSTQNSDWADQEVTAMCTTSLHTVDEFKNVAGKLDLSIPVAGDLFGMGASGSYTDKEVDTAYSNICSNGLSVKKASNHLESSSKTISDAAENAYTSCVNSLQVIISELTKTDQADFPSYLVITVTRVAPDKIHLEGRNYLSGVKNDITAIYKPSGVKNCTINGKSFGHIFHKTLGIDSPNFQGDCTTNSNNAVVVQVTTTNFGITNSVSVPAYAGPPPPPPQVNYPVPGQSYRIQNAFTGLFLTVTGDNTSTDENGPVKVGEGGGNSISQQPCASNQTWQYLQPTSAGGGFYLQSSVSNDYLDVPKGDYTINNPLGQIKVASSAPPLSSLWRLFPAHGNGDCFWVQSLAQGILWEPNQTQQQPPGNYKWMDTEDWRFFKPPRTKDTPGLAINISFLKAEQCWNFIPAQEACPGE
jgi:hypothetical protein